MQRDALIAMVESVGGPLGPLGSLADVLARRDKTIADADFDSVDVLIDLIVHPPAESVRRKTVKWQMALIDCLVVWGRRDPARMLAKIAPLVRDPKNSAAAIAVVGGLRDPGGLRMLRPLVDDAPRLSGDVLAALAGALGEIGGSEANSLIGQLSALPNISADVRKELDIAKTASLLTAEQRSWVYPTLREMQDRLPG